MKQIYGIVIISLTLYCGGLGMPTKSELSLDATTTNQEKTPENNEAIIETELILVPKVEANSITVEIPDTNKEPEPEAEAKAEATTTQEPDHKESSRNVENSSENINKISVDKEEDHKFKDSPKDVALDEIHRQSEVWKDLEDDFSLLADRMPDLTEEDYDELNQEGAMPFNFLKSLDVKEGKKKVSNSKSHSLKSFTPVFITVPIVINSHSTLPISLNIGGQEIPLKLPSSTKDSVIMPANIKTSNSNTMATPTSIFNKLMDYNEPPLRQTNRHRSNNRKKIYARNNNHQVEEFEYKNEDN